MRVPFSWLNDFVKISDSPEEASKKLRAVGVPVEKVEYLSQGIDGVFAGKIETLTRHPDADKLRIAQVNLGNETLQIITGAPNVSQGDIVPIAKIGANLAEEKKIKESKLRGLPSYGMMCSADELGLAWKESLPLNQQQGVMILDEGIPLGVDLSKTLGLNEAVFVLEPFANRPDYLSIFGVAREVAAIYDLPLKFPDLYPQAQGTLQDKIKVVIENKEACYRYTARLLINIKVTHSPLWMVVRLQAAGVRSINNVVDVTNYVMLELGQPLHAFDYQLLKEKKIVVRSARPSEKIVGIDGKTYDLTPDNLVIAEGNRPVAIGGVMGGNETEISGVTQEVLLEAGAFNPVGVRRTSFRLGLRTESSRRFEKGLAPLGAELGSRRACHLLQQMGATVLDGGIDEHVELPTPQPIQVRVDYARKILGIPELKDSNIEKILKGLGFEIKSATKDGMQVLPPPLRKDLHQEMDVIEEVARHYGYDKVPATLPSGKTTPAWIDPSEIFYHDLQDSLRSLGLTEVINYSLLDPAHLQKFGESSVALIRNPLTEDRKALRPMLYPGLLGAIKRNLSFKEKNLSFFEMGNVFQLSNGSIEEQSRLAIALTGELPWGRTASFFSMKGILEEIFRELHLETSLDYRQYTDPRFHPLRFVRVAAKEITVGHFGEMHPGFLESQDIEQPVIIAELFLDRLLPLQGEVCIKPLPVYPDSRRDISMIVDEKVPAGEIMQVIREHGEKVVEDVRVFDVYQGEQVPAHKKSIAFSITYRSSERTLTDEEVQTLHGKIHDALKATFNASLR